MSSVTVRVSALLGPIERRRSRMSYEDVDDRALDIDGEISVCL